MSKADLAGLRVLTTPCLLLDEQRMSRNIARLRHRLTRMNLELRPHLKTARSVEVARRMMTRTSGPATVSTLKEAEEFSATGVDDLLYAVGIAPAKLERVLALRARGIDLSIVLDSIEQAEAVSAQCLATGIDVPVLIEIDSDSHRGGVRPDDPLLVEIGRILQRGAARLRGVMTHFGGSYDCRGVADLERAAEREREAAVAAANRLRAAGLPAPVVSVGSTPTAHFARDLTGVTEVRAGVFVFFDLVMAGIGVCSIDDIALSVLATVIGHRARQGQIIIDAGWMALSRDRGTANQSVDYGYGLVCSAAGEPQPDLFVQQANQEHGIIASRTGSTAHLAALSIGSQVRILPNHACATAAQHTEYVVLAGSEPAARWPRIPSGW